MQIKIYFGTDTESSIPGPYNVPSSALVVASLVIVEPPLPLEYFPANVG